jgi:hypothetical protein
MRSEHVSQVENRSEHLSPETRSDHVLHPETRSEHVSAGTRTKRRHPEMRSEHVSAGRRTKHRYPEMRSEHVSPPEMRSERVSAPHDVVVGNHKHRSKHIKTTTTDTQRLVESLLQLNPPFENPEVWLEDVSLRLVQAWLEYLEDLNLEERSRIRNEAAFLRVKVATGQPPQRRRTHPKTCPQCGKPYFDRAGRCLVCAGVVHV